MLVAEEITKNSAAYLKRRMLWKAVNRARNRFTSQNVALWERQMRKFLDGEALALRTAMRKTFVNVGAPFADYQFKKIAAVKASNRFDQELASYANSDMSSITASIGNTLESKASDIINNPDLTEGEKKELIDKLIASRAKIVSDNEVTRASNVGTAIGAGVAILLSPHVFVKTWLATIDGRVRDTHEGADGQTVGNREEFIVGGEALQRPLDPSGSIANTINCRCAVDYQKL